MELSPCFSSLPRELLHTILDYDTRIRYRQGKYMNRIPPNDPRYDMLRTVPQPRDVQLGDRFHRLVQFSQGPSLQMAVQVAPTVDGTLIMYMYYRKHDSYTDGHYIRW
jgi:hypothetical protein